MNVIAFDHPGKTKNFQIIGSVELFYDMHFFGFKDENPQFILDIQGKGFDFWIVKEIIGHIFDYIKIEEKEMFLFPSTSITMDDILKLNFSENDTFFITIKSPSPKLLALKTFIYYLEKGNWNNLQEMLDLNTIQP